MKKFFTLFTIPSIMLALAVTVPQQYIIQLNISEIILLGIHIFVCYNIAKKR